MEFMDTVIRRQSCRAFAPGQVALEEIETILKAANAAPVSMGLYGNIHISVIQDEALIAALEEYTYRAFPDEGEHPAYQAPTLFSINCLKKEREAGAWADASAIAENILLAAADLGLGSIYLMGIPQAVRNDAGLVGRLRAPEGFLPYVMVGVGHPAGAWEKRSFTTSRINTVFI